METIINQGNEEFSELVESNTDVANKIKVTNSVIWDKSLSLGAKGLYLVMCSYINDNNCIISKDFLKERCKEGDKAFETLWKELKDKGYIKQHKIQTGSGFSYEYELLNGSTTNNIKLLKANIPGYFYVMKCLGYYKIGISIDCKRLGEYTHLPEEPEYPIIEFVNDMNKVEIMIHKKYNYLRLRDDRCEWFNLSENDIDDINNIIKPYIIENPNHSKYYFKYKNNNDIEE